MMQERTPAQRRWESLATKRDIDLSSHKLSQEVSAYASAAAAYQRAEEVAVNLAEITAETHESSEWSLSTIERIAQEFSNIVDRLVELESRIPVVKIPTEGYCITQEQRDAVGRALEFAVQACEREYSGNVHFEDGDFDILRTIAWLGRSDE